MAKEERKALKELAGTPQPQEEKLDQKKIGIYIGQLEERLKRTSAALRDAQKEIELYQMQDYYQRAQLLCVILANDKLNEDFRKKCEDELQKLVYPPKPESKEEQPTE